MSATCNAPTQRPGARMVSTVARVTVNEQIGGGCRWLVADVQGGWPESGAGQFAMLSLEHPRFPILPRPFSLLGWQRRADGDELEWMIMPVGVGTGLLCSLAPGDALDVVGPLGHRMDADLPDGPIVCVGGGYGIAPFVFLLEAWRRQGDPRADRTTVIFGARTESRLALVERLHATGSRIELCTDDGSRGRAGRVDARLAEVLAERPCGMVLTCGPEAMMEAVGEVCRQAGVPSRASLETVMGCGYAVCNGCAVAVSDGSKPGGYTYELACREGTVFDETRLLWHQP